ISTRPYAGPGNISLSFERVLDEDSILAFGACGKQGDRTTHQFLDPADVFDGLGGQIGPRAGIGGGLFPTFYSLVDRHNASLCALPGRQMVDLLAVQIIAGANLDRIEAVQDVEFCQRQPVDAAGAHGLTDQRRIKPAAAPLASGIDPELPAPPA